MIDPAPAVSFPPPADRMSRMFSGSVLLFNLDPEEIHVIEDLLSQFEVEISSIAVTRMEEAEAILGRGDALLTLFRISTLPRPDQTIHRLKRFSGRPVPLLAILPQELAGKARGCLSAGADDYWVLPLDPASFAPRFHVMLQWGLSCRNAEPAHAAPAEESRPSGGDSPPRVGMWRNIRRALGFGRSGKTSMAVNESLIAGGWERIRRLGFGSFAEVWLVREFGKKSLAVAKIPHDKKSNMKFMREAAILKRLAGHPNATRLIGMAKEEGKAIIIQEYAEGVTLQETMDQGMDSALKETAFLELMDVVAHAHRHRIMHRDIKPENIIIDVSGHVKLLDFGTGKDLTRRSISSTIIGSRPFMAPEQIMGKSRLASDVWALGVILYALSTEYLPFYDENEKHLMDLILEINPERPRDLEPDLPEELEAIVLRCLEKDWTMRYRDAIELQKDLLTVFPEFGRGKVLGSGGAPRDP